MDSPLAHERFLTQRTMERSGVSILVMQETTPRLHGEAVRMPIDPVS
jgi:hypothetical protein